MDTGEDQRIDLCLYLSLTLFLPFSLSLIISVAFRILGRGYRWVQTPVNLSFHSGQVLRGPDPYPAIEQETKRPQIFAVSSGTDFVKDPDSERKLREL